MNTRDVGDRLFRMRAGIPNHEKTTTMAPAPSAKGGLASKEPIVSSVPTRWEIWGNVFYYTADYDNDIRITTLPLVNLDSDIDVFGGTIGFEHHFSDVWTGGLAVSASTGEMDSSVNGLNLSSVDVDTFSVIPYVSYYRDNSLFGADVWADLMYAYTDLDYETRRNVFGAIGAGSPQGSTHTLEFNTGLNFGGGSVTHGPYAGVRWIDGDIDGYTETIGGALGAVYPSVDVESLVSILGYHVSVPIEVGSGVVVPQFRAAWEHEFEESRGSLGPQTLGAVDEDTAIVGVGVGYYCNSGWNTVLDYEAQLGEDLTGHYVGSRIGKEF